MTPKNVLRSALIQCTYILAFIKNTESESEQEDVNQLQQSLNTDGTTMDSGSDSGMEATEDPPPLEGEEEVTTVELLAARRDKLKHDKLRIGALCSSLLESPEKKVIALTHIHHVILYKKTCIIPGHLL